MKIPQSNSTNIHGPCYTVLIAEVLGDNELRSSLILHFIHNVQSPFILRRRDFNLPFKYRDMQLKCGWQGAVSPVPSSVTDLLSYVRPVL